MKYIWSTKKESCLSHGKAPLKLVVDTEPIHKAIEGNQEMLGIYSDYKGIPVIGASLQIPEYGWILLSEMDRSEAFTPP